MTIQTKRPLARILISLAIALAFAGAAPMAALAETGVDPAVSSGVADEAASDDSAVDFAPGFKDFETDQDMASLKKAHQFEFDEVSIQDPAAAARPAKWIEVVLSKQMLYAWQNGRVVMSSCFVPKVDSAGLECFAEGGAAKAVSLKVYTLKSAWR